MYVANVLLLLLFIIVLLYLFLLEHSKMLRNWKQVCLLSNHLRSFGHIYPTSTSIEILRQEQTFASLCGGCIRQIKLFHIPLTNAGSPLKREGRRYLHQSEFVKPNYGVVITLSKDADSNHEEITPDWTVHERLIATCSGIWDECPDGSSFIVSYVDTAWQLTKAEKVRLPTVLAPARDLAHSDSLKPLLGSLARNGFRVIMPYLVGLYAPLLICLFSMFLQLELLSVNKKKSSHFC